MATEREGGAAFPVPMVTEGGGFYDVSDGGMSLLDWFAGRAMQAMTSRECTPDFFPDIDGMADEAYRRGLAMLRAKRRAIAQLLAEERAARAAEDAIPY